MYRENDIVYTGSVSWTLDQNATKTLSIPIPDFGAGDGPRKYVVSVYNKSAVVTLEADFYNKETFDAEVNSLLTSVASVPVSSASSVVVEGFLYGSGGGQIILTKSAATAAAFSAYIVIRRI